MQKQHKKRAATLCLALFSLLCLFSACEKDNSAVSADFPTDVPSARPGWFYEGVQPCLRYNEKLYYWEGISKQKHTTMGNHGIQHFTVADTSSYLPEDCVEIGEIRGCTAKIPTKELQLQADFKTFGPVYQNPDNPEVLYAWLANTWGNAGDFYYVRFVTEALCDSQLIFWQGNLYRIATGRTDITPWLKELPTDCEVIGQLSFVGEDVMPSADLQCNHRSDGHGYQLDGREVLAVPGDDSTIYVYAHRYWAKGDYPAWLACSLWTPPQ